MSCPGHAAEPRWQHWKLKAILSHRVRVDGHGRVAVPIWRSLGPTQDLFQTLQWPWKGCQHGDVYQRNELRMKS